MFLRNKSKYIIYTKCEGGGEQLFSVCFINCYLGINAQIQFQKCPPELKNNWYFGTNTINAAKTAIPIQF